MLAISDSPVNSARWRLGYPVVEMDDVDDASYPVLPLFVELPKQVSGKSTP